MSLPYIKIGIFGAINTKKVMLPQPPLLHGRMGIIATPGSYVMSCYLESWRLQRRLRNPREHSWRRFAQTRKLYFCGRANDVMIRTSCESVLVNKVDRAVAGACDCALTLPDEKYGEALCAAIVLAKGISPATPAASPSAASGSSGDKITEDAQWTEKDSAVLYRASVLACFK